MIFVLMKDISLTEVFNCFFLLFFFLTNFLIGTARHPALTALTKVTILREQQNQKYNQSPDVLHLPLDIFSETT